MNNEGGRERAGGRAKGIARFGVYSEMHGSGDPFSHSRGGKVGSRRGAQCGADAVRCCAPGLIRLEHAPKRANAQIAFILAS